MILRTRAQITERAEDWEIVWSDGTRATVPSAGAARKAVMAKANLATAGSVTLVEWEPTTVIGRQVVRVLTAARDT